MTSSGTEQLQHAQAHRRATEASIADLVKTLQEVLGRKLVAAIADVDVKTVDRWADGKSHPRPESEARLRTAYQVYQMLLRGDSEHTARAWFLGLNPQLDDISPIEALSEGRTREVLVAAKSFTLGG
jgi:hypothetical protein